MQGGLPDVANKNNKLFPQLGQTYIKKLLIVYLKLNFYCASCVLPALLLAAKGLWAHLAAVGSRSSLTASYGVLVGQSGEIVLIVFCLGFEVFIN